MISTRRVAMSALCLLLALPAVGSAAKSKEKVEEPKEKSRLTAETFAGLELRSIGPAIISGRIIDLAVDPREPATWYVAAASGGVWKTANAGTTWTPIFDDQGSYSIGCVTIDPNDPLTVWVGTGENNSQRSVSYGDGVYKSIDGGKSWENVGLKSSEHIGKIVVDPRDSNVVYVAAQGPLWAPGGDRGLYKTTTAARPGRSVRDRREHRRHRRRARPGNPDVIYAATYQRRRHVWTLIDGGPGSGIYKSTDGGKTWKKLTDGLPKEDMGRIGLAVAPADPDLVYAIVEAANKAGGFFRSTDGGGTWEKTSDYVAGSPSTTRRSSPTPATRTASTRWTPGCWSPRTAARPSTRSARRRSTSTTTRCGSTPATAST